MLLKMQILTEAVDGQGNGIVCFAGWLLVCFQINWLQLQIWKGKCCLTCYNYFIPLQKVTENAVSVLLFISSRDKYWSYAVANRCCCIVWLECWFPWDTQNEVGKAACLFVKRSCRKCGSLGNIHNISSQMVNTKKKVLENFCRKDRILDFEMHWKAQMWYKRKATNEFLDWDNWVLWHCVPSLIYGVRRARKSNVQCSRVLNSVVFKLDPWSRGCF